MGGRLQIAVVGAGICDDATDELAAAVGRAVAAAGAVLVTGGRTGVMAAASAAARQAGGRVVGILPGRDATDSPPADAVEVAIYTGMGNARNQLVVLSAAAVVAVAGSWGTLSEIALALKQGIPVVSLQSWNPQPPDGRPEPLLQTADTPDEAVRLALEAARTHGRRL